MGRYKISQTKAKEIFYRWYRAQGNALPPQPLRRVKLYRNKVTGGITFEVKVISTDDPTGPWPLVVIVHIAHTHSDCEVVQDNRQQTKDLW